MIRLMEYMNNAGLPYRVYAFTEQTSLIEAVCEHGLILVVCADIVYRELAGDPRMQRIPIVCLTDEAVTVPRTAEGSGRLPDAQIEDDQRPADRRIYRYRPASRLVDDITACVMPLLPRQSDGEMPVYMVYSPCAASGKTTMALELARQLPGSLYIGMEDYNSLGVNEMQMHFGRLLYAIMQEDPAITESLLSIRQVWHNSYFIPSADAYYDLCVLDLKHLQWFIDRTKQSGQYTALIMDIGTGALEDPGLLRLGHRIVIPVYEDEVSKQKHISMKRAFDVWDCQDVLDRMEVIPVSHGGDWKVRIQNVVRELI